MARPTVPTGITTEAFSNSIKIQWRANDSPDVKGYNVYNSQTSGGGVSGYTRLNDELIEIYNKIVREVTSSTESVNETGGIRTTTVTETIEQVTYFAFVHDTLEEKKTQFYVITAVNNNGEESLPSTEIYDTPLIIDTNIEEIPRRTKSEVILSYLDEIRRHDKKIDVKPGSITRDLHIDPHGAEFERAYILIDFHSRASSFLTLKQYDDADNDRISDEVSESETKTLLRSALGYNEDGSQDNLVQDIVDNAFDRLASNSFTVRKAATNSQGEITFYTINPPSDDVIINAGEIISTLPGQNTPSVNFKTLSTAIFISSNAETYFDQVSQRYELTVPIEAVETGSNGNVSANTIISTTIGEFNCTNELSTFGGTEKESNADLADRALLAYRSLDVGTLNGYTRNTIEIHNVEDVEIIDAGHYLMQRDYDEIRRKHVYGKVDIYFQGEVLEEFTENIGFLYKEVLGETVQIIETETASTNLLLRTVNTDVTAEKPIFDVSYARNTTQGFNYDIKGNVSIFVDGVLQEKGRFKDVEVNLTSGELVFSSALGIGKSVTAKYDSYVENETVIFAAAGGETTGNLSNIGDEGIREESYNIFKNDVELIETTDFSLNLITGQITFVTPLSTGDNITANYAYIINPETVLALSVGGERSLFLAAPPVYPSISYNGTDFEINRFNDINSSVVTNLTDIIEVNYRFRDADPIVLKNQPARYISSLSGTVSGSLIEGTHYVFNSTDDIILEGNSTRAQRNFQITYNELDGLPTGIENNTVDLIALSGLEPFELTYKGVIESSVIVQNSSRTITYIKNIDYQLNFGEPNDPITIQRITTGSISNGQTVLVDYNYGEILIVRYVVNNLVKKVQDNIDIERHITADVLVKESPQTKVDITLSVKLTELAEVSVTKDAIITAISDEINQKKMGESVYKSDIVRAVDSVNGVNYVLLPMNKMVKTDGSIVVREEIDRNRFTWALIEGTTQTWVTALKWEKINPISNGTWTVTTQYLGIVNVESFIYNSTTGETYSYVSHTDNTVTLTGITPPQVSDVLELTYYTRAKALTHNTLGNVGNITQSFGVFENDELLTLVETEGAIDTGISQALISSDGAVLVSPRNFSNPNGASYTVTYFIYGETGDNDIVISEIEHLDPGTITVLIA